MAKKGIKYVVYEITINEYTYIGHTKDPVQRLAQHIYSCYSAKSASYSKPFYKCVRFLYPSKESGLNALKNGFKILRGFTTKADAKRWEMFLILERYFGGKPIYQKIPQIRDM